MSNFRGISDPRDYGSKNPELMFLEGDRLAGLLTFMDFAKGYFSVVLASSGRKSY